MQQKLTEWSTSTFTGTYSDAKSQSESFNAYKRSEKRNYVAEKTDLEYLLGNIQTKVKTYGLRAYTPPSGLRLEDLDLAWRELGRAEAVRSKAINAKIGGYDLVLFGFHISYLSRFLLIPLLFTSLLLTHLLPDLLRHFSFNYLNPYLRLMVVSKKVSADHSQKKQTNSPSFSIQYPSQ